MNKKFALVMLLAVMTVVASACATAQAAPKRPVEVKVTASEFKFDAARTTFKAGTTYRFVVTNAGKINHDFLIMPAGEQDEEKALLLVEDTDLTPGTTLTKDFVFTQPGSYEFACRVQGHYEAGMVTKITVQ